MEARKDVAREPPRRPVSLGDGLDGVAVLADIGHLLQSVDTPRERIEAALRLLKRVVPWSRCAVLDSCSTDVPLVIVLPSSRPSDRQALDQRLALLQRLLGDVPGDGADRDAKAPARGDTYLALPLVALEEPVGVVLVERDEPYTERDLQVLSVVAGQIGSFLANVRLRAQEQLAAKATECASQLLERIHDGVVELDEQGRCQRANPAAEVLLGSKLVGTELRSVFGSEAAAALQGAFDRGWNEGAETRLEALHQPSVDRWFECDVYPTRPCLSLFLRDITERRQADEFRERVIGIISHDLRTPLSAIMLSADRLDRTPDLPERVTFAVGRIRSSGARMAEMVSQLLDFTRARLGSFLPLALVPTDLGELCGEVVDELSAANPEREIHLERSGDLHGRWAPARIAQIASNLVSNALQHGAPDRPVDVTVAADPGESVRIEVWNEGPPIPPTALGSIFRPFRHAADTSRSGAGTSGLGLGLFIVHEIVDAHDGTIEVTSEPAGTRFVVRLPRDGKR